ncbi:cytochrome P450 [Dendrothele bispora CBS 962.96]|uniref:Cytochrome P450 n=1 Tax=Dendrothele bispora (strain CBS 962.96) TaxID=1314807 RepID=A0A4S8KMW9_DENBC|nr:cytochrome P450 [Dendrothele bispora CBS 962.96]
MIVYVAEFFAAIASVLWFYRKRMRNYSHSIANLPSPKSKSWWKGNFEEALNPRAWNFHVKLLKEYDSVVRLDGVMGDKQLIVWDPKAMHHILVKDHAIYDRSMLPATALILGKGLSGITGEAHRKQRRALNPVFSIAHMRDMLPIFYDVVHNLERGLTQILDSESGIESQEIEMLSWMSRTALELIGQAGLGYSFDTLEDDTVTHPYIPTIKQLMNTVGKMWITRDYIVPLAVKIGTPKLRRWVMDRIPWPNVHRVRDMSDYMWGVSKEIYAAKRDALAAGDEAVERQVGRGKDIMSILMKMNLKEESEDKLDEDEVLGQMSSIFALSFNICTN